MPKILIMTNKKLTNNTISLGKVSFFQHNNKTIGILEIGEQLSSNLSIGG